MVAKVACEFTFFCDLQMDGLTLISENDWMLFSEDWNVMDGKGISAEIAFRNSSVKKVAGSCEEMPISEEDLSRSVDEANDDLEARRPYIKTYPEVKIF